MIANNEESQNLEQQEETSSKSQMNVGTLERVGSIIGGAVLTGLGLRRHSLFGMLVAGAGMALAARGVTGRCGLYKKMDVNTARHRESTHHSVTGSVTIKASPEELYRQWKDPEVFSKVFESFADVSVTSNESSHWSVRTPLGRMIEWESWITEERPGEFIGWKSSEDSKLPNAGQLVFRQAPGDKGTELLMDLHFYPPAGMFGQRIVDIFGVLPRSIALKALRRFKRYVETGEMPDVHPQQETESQQGGSNESPMLERS